MCTHMCICINSQWHVHWSRPVDKGIKSPRGPACRRARFFGVSRRIMGSLDHPKLGVLIFFRRKKSMRDLCAHIVLPVPHRLQFMRSPPSSRQPQSAVDAFAAPAVERRSGRFIDRKSSACGVKGMGQSLYREHLRLRGLLAAAQTPTQHRCHPRHHHHHGRETCRSACNMRAHDIPS
jgi:hypothetical protein